MRDRRRGGRHRGGRVERVARGIDRADRGSGGRSHDHRSFARCVVVGGPEPRSAIDANICALDRGERRILRRGGMEAGSGVERLEFDSIERNRRISSRSTRCVSANFWGLDQGERFCC
jgi:hypothetical protein